MKFSKLILAAVAALTLVQTVHAQFNLFGEPRKVIVLQPKAISASYTGTTNDLRQFDGTATLDIVVVTNAGDAAIVVDCQGSATGTSGWASLANVAVATQATIITTNAAGFNSTNIYNLPGTIVTPTASTAGFATPYLLSAPYTGTGLVTGSTAVTTLGFNISDAPRYLRCVATGATNGSLVSVILTGRKGN